MVGLEMMEPDTRHTDVEAPPRFGNRDTPDLSSHESGSQAHHSPGNFSVPDINSGDISSTSTSTTETSQTSTPRYGARAHLTRETLDFLRDFRNYLPLGCLCFEDFTSSDEQVTTPDWLDVADCPGVLDHGALLGIQLNKLMVAGWINIHMRRSRGDGRFIVFRVYVLPCDAGHRFVDRRDRRMWSALEGLLSEIDSSPESWNGYLTPSTVTKFDMWATPEEGSLFYHFNKLPSPAPSPGTIDEKYAREALEDLLDPQSVLPGLKTVLYPYQRRSAGLMLQRESVTTSLTLDPRLERRIAPDGSTYYYGPKDLLFLRHPRYYETCRGGILAETMGLGKTVIMLSLILATKSHPPKYPTSHSGPPKKPGVSSLADMSIANINRKSIPWKVEFDRIQHATGQDMSNCMSKLSLTPPRYYIHFPIQRWNRKTVMRPPKKMTLAATTIIVVPRNLCKQWRSEIAKHVEQDALRVLVMEDLKRALPPPDELRLYDIVLFSRNRFELEIRDGSDEQGRRILSTQLVCRCPYIGATRTRDCHCVRDEELYDSPLKHLHFKRLVIDEGHFFSSSNTTAVAVANKLITVDHRWVVSGTPAKDLLGVEVDMSTLDVSAAETMWQNPQTKDCREAILHQRRHFSSREDTNGAVKSLGALASNFLKMRPWYTDDTGEVRAEWDDYIYRHENLRKRTYSSFSGALRQTLETMVVKTQPEDVERDIELPPLSHEVIRLEPSLFDKLTANLFTLVLHANAVTSERRDADYLFHKNSAQARIQLISNLRQSAFFWTGFSEADIEASIKNSTGYLAKEGTSCTEEDRALLSETMSHAKAILDSAGWKSMSRSHELGLFVNDWPEGSAEHWAFDESRSPLLTGVSQLLEAQQHVNGRTILEDPGEGLSGAGIRALAPARHGSIKEENIGRKKTKKAIVMKGIPTSSLDGEPTKRRASFSSKSAIALPKLQRISFKTTKPQKKPIEQDHMRAINVTAGSDMNQPSQAGADQTTRKRRRSEVEKLPDLPHDSGFLRSRIVGTSSAKLSYLISQILKYYRSEKILVFYDGDNVAYYIAQMLELLHIKHEIYAKSLAASLKSEYVVRFDQEAQDRVLLMDVKQAAYGLNLSSASRIYFVNPVCRPNVEAQAIKRAHRIGQTQKVFVETLVLRGSIEEKMLERSKRMTRSEHLDAKALEDDGGIRQIIQSAAILPVDERELTGAGQMAPLEVPQQLWGRQGWRDTVANAVSAEIGSDKRQRVTALHDVTADNDEARIVQIDSDTKHTSERRTLAYVDCTDTHAESEVIEEDSGDEPMVNRWRRASTSNPPAHESLEQALRPGGSEMMLPSMHIESLHPP